MSGAPLPKTSKPSLVFCKPGIRARTSSAVPALLSTVPCTRVSKASSFIRVTGKSAFTVTSSNILASGRIRNVPTSPFPHLLYKETYPTDETRSKSAPSGQSRRNAPSSLLTVPVTNAESGSDNTTTLAYANGRPFSSTSFPPTACADKPTGSVILISITKNTFILFISQYVPLIFHCKVPDFARHIHYPTEWFFPTTQHLWTDTVARKSDPVRRNSLRIKTIRPYIFPEIP